MSVTTSSSTESAALRDAGFDAGFRAEEVMAGRVFLADLDKTIFRRSVSVWFGVRSAAWID